MQQVAFNRQTCRDRNWMKVTTSASTITFRQATGTKTISGLRIMSTRLTSPSMNIYKVESATATVAPLFASQKEYIRSERSQWNGSNNYIWANAMAAAMTAILGVAIVKMNEQQESNTECCGIAGVVGSSKNHDAR